MFRKQFKVKSQVHLKSTEKKKFLAELTISFPHITEADVDETFSTKGDIVKTKVITFNDELVDIYYIDRVPMFFDICDYNLRLPTVYSLWKCPNLTSTLTTNSYVLEKIRNGADLFFPGIVLEGLKFNKVSFVKDEVVSLNLIDNKICHAVGQAMIEQDMIEQLGSKSGKVLKVFHCVGDALYKQQSSPRLRKLGPPDWVFSQQENKDAGDAPEEPRQNRESSPKPVAEKDMSEKMGMEELMTVVEEMSETDKMDKLLLDAFLTTIKRNPKNFYPILPATLYATHILSNLPPNETLNIKKTRWKKFSTFLQVMSYEGIILLEEIRKNEFRVAAANLSHPRVRDFVCDKVKRPETPTGTVIEPVIQQVYIVNAAVYPFFELFGCKKKDQLTRNNVRNYLNEHIKNENLIHPLLKDHVILDPVLYEVLKCEQLSRADLLTRILDKMGIEHKISSTATGTVTTKGKMPFIEFELGTRSGNKKVTMINNLEIYGVDVFLFAKELQILAAASTTINAHIPGKKGPQVQVQGNQIHLAVRILQDKFKIPEKHMKGLEKASKKKLKS